MTRELLAPAKVNLGLRVVGRRSDGYHLLESVFVPIDLADRLSVTIAPARAASVRLELEDPTGILLDAANAAENLATRAARDFLAAARVEAEVLVRLRKCVPAGAGLGGGSSDAGAVLRILRDEWPEALAREELAQLALGLGADVPFFLDPQPAWVEGIGEQITPLPDFPRLVLLLVTPSPPLATEDVFRCFAARHPDALTPRSATRSMPAPKTRGGALTTLLRGGPSGTWRGAEELLTNDLEEVASELRPEIRELGSKLRARGAGWAALSGSGPTVFGIFSGTAAAEAAASAPWGKGVRIHVAQTWTGLTAPAETPKV